MALDLARVAAQLQDLVPRLQLAEQRRNDALPQLRRALTGDPLEWRVLATRVEERIGLPDFPLPARLLEDPGNIYPNPQISADFTVLAADGSQVDLDRHAPAACYVINTSRVILQYGTYPSASLSSFPVLAPADPFDADDEDESDQEARAGRERIKVDLERDVAEIRALRGLVEAADPELPALAVRDGSLILWNARSAGEGGRHYVDRFVDELEAIRRAAAGRPIALASYISGPGSREAVNALRSAFCHSDRGVCERECGSPARRQCRLVEGIRDLELFAFLQPGERSALFANRQRVLAQYGELNKVCFFYLNAGTEIGRVEIPAWVAEDPDLLAIAHGLVYDQCRRNFGYPAALMEAHEQAVVSEADRQEFWQLVRLALAGAALPEGGSAKAFTKRSPWA